MKLECAPTLDEFEAVRRLRIRRKISRRIDFAFRFVVAPIFAMTKEQRAELDFLVEHHGIERRPC